jgi:choice-of-anchor B domain-containing protein
MRARTLLLAVAIATSFAPAARAQQADCVGGVAAGYACSNVNLLSRVPLSTFGPNAGRISETWGWTDPVNGREYAILGVFDGTVFVDVTTPTAPVYVGKLTTHAPDPVNGRWRVFRTYQDHLFVGSEIHDHGVQVFDLTRLRDVVSPPATFTEDAHYSGNGSTHTLAINEATGFMYLAGAVQAGYACNGGGLHIVDIRTPLAPAYAGCAQVSNGVGDSDTYVHETECLVYDGPDADHAGREICVDYAEESVTFVDVTDKSNPTVISHAFYPNYAYTHQGTFTSDQRYLLVDDELDETNGTFNFTRTVILDVQDLDNVEFVGNHLGPTGASDHNQYTRGRYIFQGNYKAGLRILDAQNVSAGTLTEVAYFDTFIPDDSPGFDGVWMAYPFFASGNVVAGDRDGGLFVLRPTGLIVAGEEGPEDAGFGLTDPAPNPTHGSTTIRLTVESPQAVIVDALDALGRRVAMLHDGPVAAGGDLSLVFNATHLPAGPYVIRATGETFTATTRVSVAH